MRIATYNVEYGGDWYEGRYQTVNTVLADNQVDVTCLQESKYWMTHQWREGPLRVVAPEGFEGFPLALSTPLLLRNDMNYPQNEHEFLSENKSAFGDNWDSDQRRGLFLNVWDDWALINTHFDQAGSTARERSAERLLKMIERVPRDTVVVTMDGNFNPGSRPHEILSRELTSNYQSECGHEGPEMTYPSTEPRRRLDYIWATHDVFRSSRTVTEPDLMTGTPSDHLPIVVDIEI